MSFAKHSSPPFLFVFVFLCHFAFTRTQIVCDLVFYYLFFWSLTSTPFLKRLLSYFDSQYQPLPHSTRAVPGLICLLDWPLSRSPAVCMLCSLCRWVIYVFVHWHRWMHENFLGFFSFTCSPTLFGLILYALPLSSYVHLLICSVLYLTISY